MESALKSFERRQRAVAQKHRKLAQGYVTKINRNGVFEHRPIRRLPSLRLRGTILAVLGFFVFKGVMFANLGSGQYADHLARLSDGSFADKLGAWLLGVDPVTFWIGVGLRTLLT